MSYLYHKVKEDMQGDTLYPLNELKNIYPKIYKEESAKYKGREFTMEYRIPGLDCLWNDVLHFTAVSPADLKRALVEAGHPVNFSESYYQIDPKLLDPEKTIVYLYLYTYEDGKAKMVPENFAPYDPSEIDHYSVIPESTKAYYREMYNQKKLPLMYVRVPHILYKGSLNIKDLNIVTA